MKQLRVLTSYTPTQHLNKLAWKSHNITEFRIIPNCMADYETSVAAIIITISCSIMHMKGRGGREGLCGMLQFTILEFSIWQTKNFTTHFLHLRIDLIFRWFKKFKCIQKWWKTFHSLIIFAKNLIKIYIYELKSPSFMLSSAEFISTNHSQNLFQTTIKWEIR